MALLNFPWFSGTADNSPQIKFFWIILYLTVMCNENDFGESRIPRERKRKSSPWDHVSILWYDTPRCNKHVLLLICLVLTDTFVIIPDSDIINTQCSALHHAHFLTLKNLLFLSFYLVLMSVSHIIKLLEIFATQNLH